MAPVTQLDRSRVHSWTKSFVQGDGADAWGPLRVLHVPALRAARLIAKPLVTCNAAA